SVLRDKPFDPDSHRALFRRARDAGQPERAFAHAALLSIGGTTTEEERQLLEARRALPPATPRVPLSQSDRTSLLASGSPLLGALLGAGGAEVARIQALAAAEARCRGF